MQALIGYANEQIVAEEIVKASMGKSKIKNRSSHREKKLEELLLINPSKVLSLRKNAQVTANSIPISYTDVEFNDLSANGGDVYDIKYFDESGNTVLLSCKTSNVEDKSYRFSTSEYQLPFLINFLKTSINDTSLTYEENIIKNGYSSVSHFLKSLRDKIAYSIINDDQEEFKDLLNDRIIGNGGFYKMIKNGNVIFYPSKEGDFHVNRQSIYTKGNSVFFEVLNEKEERIYNVSFRPKFKDGKSKMAKFSKNGSPNNIAATIKVDPIVK